MANEQRERVAGLNQYRSRQASASSQGRGLSRKGRGGKFFEKEAGAGVRGWERRHACVVRKATCIYTKAEETWHSKRLAAAAGVVRAPERGRTLFLHP